jgi:hypothetical protein
VALLSSDLSMQVCTCVCFLRVLPVFSEKEGDSFAMITLSCS